MKLHAFLSSAAIASLLASTGLAQSDPSDSVLIPAEKTNLSLRNEVKHAIDKGLSWLKEKQDASTGAWSTKDHPAVTALVLSAYFRAPDDTYVSKKPEFIKKGLEFIVSHAQEDGGIYVKDLRNYNTSVALTTLHLAEDPAYASVISKARAYVVGLQAKGLDNPALNGGIGYGPGATNRQHPDLSNTVLALEALAATRHLEAGENVDASQKLDWQAAIDFITRTQNLPSHNKEPWASDDPANKGGFIYYPGHSMAGETELPSGKKALRSYGSMSYAGLLSYVYAQLDRNDPRVKAVLEWLEKNYTLEENPGMGDDGRYYYYHMMAKALAAAQVKSIALADGTNIDWRQDLAKKLIDLQSSDGSWVNESGRWWEKDPVLVTSYAVLALEAIYSAM
jgi:squalene-hopene/tetraprenyl-beta-curcumene cyclase